jgi:hypothetical protein
MFTFYHIWNMGHTRNGDSLQLPNYGMDGMDSILRLRYESSSLDAMQSFFNRRPKS